MVYLIHESYFDSYFSGIVGCMGAGGGGGRCGRIVASQPRLPVVAVQIARQLRVGLVAVLRRRAH